MRYPSACNTTYNNYSKSVNCNQINEIVINKVKKEKKECEKDFISVEAVLCSGCESLGHYLY